MSWIFSKGLFEAAQLIWPPTQRCYYASHQTLGDTNDKEKRPNFSPEFRLETAQLVVDNGYTQEDAAKAMGVGYSTVSKWVKQLKEERKGKQPKATPMTADQLKIRELEKKIERIELEKDILKKATALLMSDSLNNSY